MSTANKLIYLNTTKTKIKDALDCGGADITTETFREYPEVLYNQYVDAAFGDTDVVYDSMPKVTASGTSASLNNTVSCRLTTELGGNSYQGAFLPAEYQQVDYIQSGSTAYIDTGFKPKQNTNVEIKCEVLNSGTRYIFGVAGSTNRYMLAQQSSNNSLVCDLYSSAYRLNSATPGYENGVHILAITNKTFYLDGVSKGTYSGNDFTATENAYIGGANTVGGSKSNIYYCKIWDNGTLVRHMIPCYRISDSVIGMYDVVNNVFYTNTSTGTFGKGNNTTLPTPDYPVDINVVTGRNELEICGKNLLDSSTLQQGGLDLGGGGTATGSENRIRTDYIIVEPNTNYTISINTNNLDGVGIGLYKKDKTYDSSHKVNGGGWNSFPKTFTTQSDTYYIRCAFKNGSTTITPTGDYQLKLEKSSTATTYEAYTGYTQEINLGKNLFDKDNPDSVASGTTWDTTSNGGIITTTGAFTGGIRWNFKVNQGQKYTFKYKQRNSNNLYLYIRTYTDSTYSTIKTTFVNDGTQTNYTVTPDSEYLQVRFDSNPAISNILIEELQLEKGSQATTYSSYFIPIELCKIGDYQDFIRRGTGKNLFDKDNANILNCYISSSTGKLVGDNDSPSILYVACKTNTTYTISRNKLGSYFAVAYTNILPAVDVQTYGRINNNTGKSITITTGEEAQYLVVRYYYGGDTGTPVSFRELIQIEENNQATSYEPYGFKDKWYLHKEIGKVVLNGSESWSRATNPNGTYRFYITKPSNSTNQSCLSNYFQYNSSYASNDNSIYIGNSNLIISRVLNNGVYIETPTAFTNWLSTHNTIVYYVLATPTDTEITYQSLINQLEALYNAKSISGQTNIMQNNTDLPFLLTVKAIKQYNAAIA